MLNVLKQGNGIEIFEITESFIKVKFGVFIDIDKFEFAFLQSLPSAT